MGLGSAGRHFVHLLHRAGFEHIVGSDVVPDRVAVAKKSEIGNTVLEPGESIVEAVMDISSGQDADLVIDVSSSDEGRCQTIRCVLYEGTIGLFGLADGDPHQSHSRKASATTPPSKLP